MNINFSTAGSRAEVKKALAAHAAENAAGPNYFAHAALEALRAFYVDPVHVSYSASLIGTVMTLVVTVADVGQVVPWVAGDTWAAPAVAQDDPADLDGGDAETPDGDETESETTPIHDATAKALVPTG